jgi:hypothetical protein
MQRPDGYPAEIKTLNTWSEHCAVARVGMGAAYYPAGAWQQQQQQQQLQCWKVHNAAMLTMQQEGLIDHTRQQPSCQQHFHQAVGV